MRPQPDIILERQKDVNALSTRRHFARLFQKYSSPLYCLNLTKANKQREEVIASEYRTFVKHVLNRELPPALRAHFIHWDVKAKSRENKKTFHFEFFQLARGMLAA